MVSRGFEHTYLSICETNEGNKALPLYIVLNTIIRLASGCYNLQEIRKVDM